MPNIKLSFLEREFDKGDRNGTTVRGYELAMINTDGETRVGRVVDTKRMRDAFFIDTCLFQIILPLIDSEVDLSLLLKDNENGLKWLEAHKKYHFDTYKKEVPMIFSVKSAKMSLRTEYVLFLENYCKKVSEDRYYKTPRGIIKALPNNAFYFDITPPMKFQDGKFIPNLYYNRKVRDRKGIFDEYSLHNLDGDEREKFLNLRGSILGKLNNRDIENKEGNFEDCFPIEHFLDVCYPVSLRQAAQYNPLTIKIELEKNKKCQ